MSAPSRVLQGVEEVLYSAAVRVPTRLHQPRRLKSSPLYHLVEERYEDVKGVWEKRFEASYGHWRGFVDTVVYAFLDCGDLEHGFARVFCDTCKSEYLLAFSCSRRGFCPSCAAKRGVIFGAFLREKAGACWAYLLDRSSRADLFLDGYLCRDCEEELLRPNAHCGGLGKEALDIGTGIGNIQLRNLSREHRAERGFVECCCLIVVSALAHPDLEVGEVEFGTSPDIPDEVVPVAPLDPRLPASAK